MQTLKHESATQSNRRTADWDIRSAPKNYLALLSAQVGSALFSFAAVWLATRLLGPGGYGWIVGIIAASQAISQLAVNWTAVSVSRYGVEEFVETGRVAKAFWTRFWIFVPNIALVLGTAPLWLPFVTSLLKLPPTAYVLILGNFLATTFWIHVQQALQAAKLMRLQATLQTLERLLVLSIISVGGLIGRANFNAVALAYVFGPIIAAAIGIALLRPYVFPIRWLDRCLLGKMLAFSVPLFPTSVVGYLTSNYLDAFFIMHFLSGIDLGVYAVTFQLAGMTLQFPLLVGTLLMPLFVTLNVEGQEGRAKRFISVVLPLLGLVWGLVCAFMAVLGGYLVPIFFGPEFRIAERLLWPLMAASAMAGPVLMGYGPYANSIAATYVPAVAATVAACVNLTLNAILIPRFGLLGCAWATGIAYGSSALVANLLVHRRTGLPQSWMLEAFAPILLGSAWGSWRRAHLEALAITIIASVMVGLVKRPGVVAGWLSLKENSALVNRRLDL